MPQTMLAILPEGKLFDSVFSEALQTAAAEAGCSIDRLEPEFSAGNRLGQSCQAIESSEWIIADLTGKNPNVMYLAGYAHGIGRKVLFIAQHSENFPFDKQRHPVIAYAGDRAFLKAEIAAVLRGGAPAATRAPAADAGREKFLSLFGDILKEHGYEHHGGVEMENSNTFVLLNQEMDLALVQDLARRARELGLRLKLM